jgi:hypothetical protein
LETGGNWASIVGRAAKGVAALDGGGVSEAAGVEEEFDAQAARASAMVPTKIPEAQREVFIFAE